MTTDTPQPPAVTADPGASSAALKEASTAPPSESEGVYERIQNGRDLVEFRKPSGSLQVLIFLGLRELDFKLHVRMPDKLPSIPLYVSARTIVQDIRQAVFDAPDVNGFTCFYLTFNGKRVSEFTELGDIPGFSPDSELVLCPEAYNDRELRVHLTRFREIFSNFGSGPTNAGVDQGISYLRYIERREENGAQDGKGKGKGKARNGTNGADGIDAFEEYDFDCTGHDLLSDIIPRGAGDAEKVKPLKSLALSSWNPAPIDRRADGDLLYLRVVTLEGATFHLTCSVSGFFINASTDDVFDPEPRAGGKAYHEHNIAFCLSKASPLFAKAYSRLLQKVQSRNPLEYLASTSASYPWAVRPRSHTADESRTLDAHLQYADQAEGFGSHDWNEELQSTRELPQTTPQETVLRDQALYRVHAEFVEAATKGAVAVMNGNALLLNPGEPGSQMYLHNNIFYSLGYDNRDTFEHLGGEAAAHVAVSKDVDGCKLVADLEIADLYTLGTVVIDYMGQRVVAQTVIPGILRRPENAEPLVKYGSVDMGQEIASDPAFHTLAQTIAGALNLSEHVVKDAKGDEHRLYTSLETKGIVGLDNRKYFLDLYRITPVDAEFLDEIAVKEDAKTPSENSYPHQLPLLRPELLKAFYESKLRAAIEEANRTKPSVAEANKSNDGEPENSDGEAAAAAEKEKGPKANASTSESPATDATAEGVSEPPRELVIPELNIAWNTDAYTRANADSTTASADTAQIRELAVFLRTDALNRLVFECLYHNPPIDGETLVRRFHARGVNMRYLSKVVKLAEDLSSNAESKSSRVPSKYFLSLCRQEMVSRGAKHVLRSLLKNTPSYLMRHCVARFLSCLFADEDVALAPLEMPILYSKIAVEEYEFLAITPKAIHERVRREVARRFQFTDLPEKFWTERSLPLLRSVCLKVGLQLEAADYFATAPSPSSSSSSPGQPHPPRFEPRHIIAHYPIAKHHDPRATLAEQALEAAHAATADPSQSQPAGLAIELHGEACAVFEQVCGPVHPATARAYTGLALAHHRAEDPERALIAGRKAVVVGERVLGVDSEEVLGWYMNLAYFEYLAVRKVFPESELAGATQTDKEKRERRVGIGKALKLMRHAVRLWEKVCGGDRNLEGASTDGNISRMLADLDQLPLAIRFLERALDTQQQILGTGAKNATILTSQESLVRLHLRQNNFHAAVAAQKRVCELFRAVLPATDERAKMAEHLLNVITARAVDEAKMKAAAAASGSSANGKKVKQQIGAQKVAAAAAAAAAAASDSTSKAAATGAGAPQISAAPGGSASKAPPSIDQLLEFIGEKPAKAGKKGVGRGKKNGK
ncbi:Intracellular distribution of mitochondria [Geranomyces michiganensis]|nr:Intracellular distribution of mitochondria [Geranomyces michiganensis]